MGTFAPPGVAADASGAIELPEFYRAIFDHAEFAVYVLRVDETGACTFDDANEGVARIAGRPIAEIRGRDPADCLPEEVAHCLLSNARICLETGQSLSYERSLDLPDGRVSWKTSLLPIPGRSGGTRHVVGLTRDITRETDLLDTAQHHASLLQRLGLTLPSAIYMLNLRTREIRFLGGDADAARTEWRKGAEAAGDQAPAQYFHPDEQEKALAHWRELGELKDGEIATIHFRILSPDGGYRRHLNRETVFSRTPSGEVELVLGVSADISEQDRARQEVRDLSDRMLTLQADEQRRIAQEFHDSTGQHLVAASLALGRVHAAAPALGGLDERQARILEGVEDARQLLQEAQRELRLLSYLLHPPEIRNQGLGDAIAGFATGFGRRSGLEVDVRVSPAANAIRGDMALHLFRVCQEAFTNVHRHAAARNVSVALDVDPGEVRLTVTDDGVGLTPPEPERTSAQGVGFDSMRERMRRLGGTVEVTGTKRGTKLVAVAPRGEV